MERSYAQRVGTVFIDAPYDATAAVGLEELPLPAFAGADAIWGALGRDDRGSIWFGMSAVADGSARLFKLEPATGAITPQGDVASALRAAGLDEAGAVQPKLHSHLQQADDGYLYFSTMDETGENWRTMTPPRWGSHVWRIAPSGGPWTHVFAAPEGLIAVQAVGTWVYALGYWDHVLYQYDTLTGKVQSRTIGAACGHVSRNFIVDLRGHAYVPRLAANGGGPADCGRAPLTATLVELDTALATVRETPLVDYAAKSPANDQGIVGYTFRKDTSIVFVTHHGHLFHIIPLGDAPALVMDLGLLAGRVTAASSNLFSLDGKRFLGAIARLKQGQAWVVNDTLTGEARAQALELPPHRALLLYGSMARDDAGRCYIGGRLQAPDGPLRPIMLRVQVP